MRPAYVWSQSAWMPGLDGTEAVLGQGPADPAAISPNVRSFPPRLMRGTSPTTRMLAATGRHALALASVEDYVSVLGSAFGEISIAIVQLEAMVTGDGKISPALFKNSVHNTAGGVLSVADRNHSPSSTLSAGDSTVAMTLLEGLLQLDDGAPAVLVAVGDESLPEPLSQRGGWPSFSAAWVLRSEPPPKPAVRFEAIVLAEENGVVALPRVPKTLEHQPCRSAFSVLEAVAAQQSTELVLSVEDGVVHSLRIGGPGATKAAS